MLDEFKKLVEITCKFHHSSPVFGRELIAILATYSMPIDLCNESEQLRLCEHLAGTFCTEWDVDRALLDRIVELYLPELHTESGHKMRDVLSKHSVVNLRSVKNIASA